MRVLSVAIAALLAAGLAACAPSDPTANAYKDGKAGYGSSDFRFTEYPASERSDPIEFGGVTEDGEQFSSADVKGNVIVVNFWYASCGPCRIEAKDLEAVWQKFKGKGVTFIGINIYDEPDTAKAFAEKFGVTYPSIMDADTGAAKLAFARVAPIQAPPVTIVLDKQARIAARILGPIDGPSVLSTLVSDALKEPE